VSAVGYYEFIRDQCTDTCGRTCGHTPDWYQEVPFAGVTHLPIHAEIIDVNPDDYDPDTHYDGNIDWETSSNTGCNMSEEMIDPEAVFDGSFDETAKNTTKFLLRWAAGLKDPVGALDWAEFINDEFIGIGASGSGENNELPIPSDNIGDSGGEGAFVQQTWYHKVSDEFGSWNYWQPHVGVYTASSVLQVKFPTEELPDSATIEIGAENIVSTWVDDEVTNPNVGAETSLQIDIKNAEPSEDKELDTDSYNYDAGDSSSLISPVFDDLKVTNPAQCTDAVYEVEIEWQSDWDYGFETLTYAWITHGEELNKQVNINVPEGTEGASVDIRYTVRALNTYGGWELDSVTHYDLFIATNEETDDGGGGGSPGPPPPGGVSPMGNNTWLEGK